MFQIRNFTDNDDVRTLESRGAFTVVEYLRDLSVSPSSAQTAYYCNEMNVRKRQVICDLSKASITLQAGAMQWTAGNVNATTGLKGVGDLFGKAVRGKVTGESAIKPEYTGDGILVTEPTYRYILLEDLNDWNGSIVLDDGLFARDYARELALRGCGVRQIRYKLKLKGLSEEDISSALSEVCTEDDELERALSAGRFKLKSLKVSEPLLKKREKLYRFLLSRGFSGASVKEAARRLLSESEEDQIS